jgi:predicted heme/steroid binding protein
LISAGIVLLGLMDWLKVVNENKNLSGVSNPGSKGVTMEELRKHKTRETGVWTVLKGNVYNITQYLDYHPGTYSPLLRLSQILLSSPISINFFHSKRHDVVMLLLVSSSSVIISVFNSSFIS